MSGHYHDPTGRYDYCDDPKCPRSRRDEPEMEETCHCGAQMRGSDHCPCCGCEQYQTECDNRCGAPTQHGPRPVYTEPSRTVTYWNYGER